MKVLHIIDSDGLYGAEAVLLTLMEEQIRCGLTPVLGSIGAKYVSEKPIEEEASRRGIRVKKFRMRHGPNFKGAFDIVRFALDEKCSILHSHGYKGNILLGFMPKKIRKIPLIATLHGYTRAEAGNLRMRLYEWLDVKSLQFLDGIVVVDKTIIDRLKPINFKTKIHVVNNAIPDFLDYGLEPSDPIVSFCKEGFIVGSLGRLSPEKGYKYLIRSFHSFLKQGAKGKLVIIGEGPERNSLEALIKQLQIEEYLLLPGYRHNAKRYLRLFDAFIMPSLTEGFPISLLESMQAGIPIIATRVGGIPDILDNGKAGLLVKSGDCDDIENAMQSLYSSPELCQTYSETAQIILTSKFSCNEMANRYKSIYESSSLFR